MHTSNLQSADNNPLVLKSFLREAKRLQSCAQSDSKALALPVLRRLISGQIFHGLSLPELFRRRSNVQRKHVLQLLALEAGFTGWAEFKRAIERGHHSNPHSSLVLRQAGYPNLWFSTLEQAQAFASANGGVALAYGQQAAVIPAH